MMRKLVVPLMVSLLLVTGASSADDRSLPEISHDGLVLKKSRGAAVLYVRPEVDFSVYKRFAILECPVAFRKDWARDQATSSKRISQKDMDKIKADLSAEFLEIFTDELQNKGGYSIVTGGGDDVLVLRPAIVDLDVTAPDTLGAGRNYTLSESSGAMTLYLELYDSLSGQILARVVDRQTSRGTGRIQWQNSVTNKVEADRILRRWAGALRERLDEVHGKGKS